MSAMVAETDLPLLRKLWIYQSERFPVARTATLLAVFSAASINVSAGFAGRPLPSWPAYLVAFSVAVIFLFQLRVCDEIKDAEEDRRYRPERPIPRGLVSLNLIVVLGAAAVPIAALAALALDLRLVWLVLLVWTWMALMTAEFGVPAWLRAHPFLYVVSHMLIMPLIDLFVTGCEWLPAAAAPPSALWLFLVLSFVNGCVLEIGRKIFAPSNERHGVETYSSLLGPRNAMLLWFAVLAVSYGFLVTVGLTIGAPRTLAAIGCAGLLACLLAGVRFLLDPNPAKQGQLDTMSGLWVVACYGSAGFAPILWHWI
jgi:UbiA prenyltransferase family